MEGYGELPEFPYGYVIEYMIFTYVDGKVKFLMHDSIDTLIMHTWIVNDCYLVLPGHGTSGYQQFDYYGIIDNKMELIYSAVKSESEMWRFLNGIEQENNPIENDSVENDSFVYYLNDTEITEDEFESYSVWSGTGTFIESIELIFFIPNTSENREIYLK